MAKGDPTQCALVEHSCSRVSQTHAFSNANNIPNALLKNKHQLPETLQDCEDHFQQNQLIDIHFTT